MEIILSVAKKEKKKMERNDGQCTVKGTLLMYNLMPASYN